MNHPLYMLTTSLKMMIIIKEQETNNNAPPVTHFQEKLNAAQGGQYRMVSSAMAAAGEV
jgi:hypothetical protein